MFEIENNFKGYEERSKNLTDKTEQLLIDVMKLKELKQDKENFVE